YTRRKANEIIAALRELDGVAYTYTTVGAGATATVNAGDVYVKLAPRAERDLTQDELMVLARERLSSIYGVRTAVLDAGGFGGPQRPIAVLVRGPDVDRLQELADQVAAV